MKERKVLIHSSEPDKSKPMVKDSSGHHSHPLKPLIYKATLVGLGTVYEELRDGVGQCTTAIIVRDSDNKMDWVYLNQVEVLDS